MSSLRLAEGSNNGGDEVGIDMGKGGGIPNDGASSLVGESMKGGGNGREWEVDAPSALIRTCSSIGNDGEVSGEVVEDLAETHQSFRKALSPPQMGPAQ
ncbi:hypothetical protein Tco_1515558 [Tanacetum coccineum]